MSSMIREASRKGEDAGQRVSRQSGDCRGKILIADDEETFCQSTADLLRDRGFLCRCVPDAAEALEVVAEDWSEIIVADINMPGNGKLEFLARLREANRDMPVILVTAYPSVGSAVQSLNLGIAGYLVKPFEFADLLALVEQSLAAVRARHRIREIGQRLRGLTSDIDTIADIQSGVLRAELIGSTQIVVELAFDGIISLLFDLKHELVRGVAQDVFQASDTASDEQRMARLTATMFEGNGQMKALSPREREVLLSLVSGNRVAAIASQLFISAHTVRNHLKSIFAKLGVRSQVELLERFKRRLRD